MLGCVDNAVRDELTGLPLAALVATLNEETVLDAISTLYSMFTELTPATFINLPIRIRCLILIRDITNSDLVRHSGRLSASMQGPLGSRLAGKCDVGGAPRETVLQHEDEISIQYVDST